MPTNNRRRTIACLLRHINMTHDPNWSSVISCLGVTSREKAVLALADLIEPEERTCQVVTGVRTCSQTQDMHVKSCSACGYVFGSEEHRQLLPGLDKRVAIDPVVIPNYCSNCGAKVVEAWK